MIGGPMGAGMRVVGIGVVTDDAEFGLLSGELRADEDGLSGPSRCAGRARLFGRCTPHEGVGVFFEGLAQSLREGGVARDEVADVGVAIGGAARGLCWCEVGALGDAQAYYMILILEEGRNLVGRQVGAPCKVAAHLHPLFALDYERPFFGTQVFA